MAEIKATRHYDFEKDPAYQSDKTAKGYEIRQDAMGNWVALKDGEVVSATFVTTDQHLVCCVPNSDGGTTTISKESPDAKPLEEVAGTNIQIYDHPRLKTRIGESLFYTRPKLKEKVDGRWIYEGHTDEKAPISIAAVLRDCIQDRLGNTNGKTPSLGQILEAVNELRDGTIEEQAIYGRFREHLIENGFMPVDEHDRPYDLSLFYIPDNFNMHVFFNDLATEKPELNRAFAKFYHEKYPRRNTNNLHAALNEIKVENPAVFMGIHNYLVEKGYIPPSPLRATLDLSTEEVGFMLKPALQEFMGPIFAWKRENEKPIEEMRFGTIEEQGAYYKLCTMLKNVPAEKPSYPEKADSMFDRAEAKRARTTIENKL
jgi:hypothetical protein